MCLFHLFQRINIFILSLFSLLVSISFGLQTISITLLFIECCLHIYSFIISNPNYVSICYILFPIPTYLLSVACMYILQLTSLIDLYSAYFYMASTDTLFESPLVCYELQYGAIIYLKCESAFLMMNISTHFRVYYHYPSAIYRSILQSFKHKAFVEDWMDLRYSVDGITPIDGLKVMHGYACTKCDYRTINVKTAKDHSKLYGEFVSANLQYWNRSAAPKYWTVMVSSEPMTSAASIDEFSIFSTCF